MIRLPDPLFAALRRVCFAQEQIRHTEARDALIREDQALRDWAARRMEAHDSGACGGVAGGCRFFPCYAVGDRLMEQRAALKARAERLGMQ